MDCMLRMLPMNSNSNVVALGWSTFPKIFVARKSLGVSCSDLQCGFGYGSSRLNSSSLAFANFLSSRTSRFAAAANSRASSILQQNQAMLDQQESTSLLSTDRRRREEEVDEVVAETGVVIIGGGLSGLAAARHCAKEGVPFVLLESSDGVGGRVRTDVCQGFLLDRGFQIFISAYPEASEVLDYAALDLKEFYAGALVWLDGEFHRVADPFRHFTDGVASLGNPIGTAMDKVLVGIVRLRASLKPISAILLSSEETTILERLGKEGFSQQMVDRFFRPFFGGIFFDRELQTTSRLFEFVFKCLALGSNTLPAAGIGAIPQQLADQLPAGSILLNSRVAELIEDEDGILRSAVLQNGKVFRAKYGMLIATEGPEAARLLGSRIMDTSASSPSLSSSSSTAAASSSSSSSITKPPRSTVCLYFAADSTPINEPVLLLNGSKEGIVNNMFFPSTVAPSYAPPGKTLVSISLVGQLYSNYSDSELEQQVRKELHSWFGAAVVDSWQHLRTYRIANAQPDQTPPTNLQKQPRVDQGVYVCGDHRDSSTFDGALVSGRRAVQALLADCRVIAA